MESLENRLNYQFFLSMMVIQLLIYKKIRSTIHLWSNYLHNMVRCRLYFFAFRTTKNPNERPFPKFGFLEFTHSFIGWFQAKFKVTWINTRVTFGPGQFHYTCSRTILVSLFGSHCRHIYHPKETILDHWNFRTGKSNLLS